MRTVLFAFFFAGFALIPILVLTKGFVTTYEPIDFEVREYTVTIMATAKPGWIEDIWEDEVDVVVNLSRWDGDMQRRVKVSHPTGGTYSASIPHEDGFMDNDLAYKFFTRASVSVVNVEHYEGFDVVTAEIAWTHTQRQMKFNRCGLLWSDGVTCFAFPRRGGRWGYRLMERLEQQYQLYIIKNALNPDASSASEE